MTERTLGFVVKTQAGGSPIEIDVFRTQPTYAFIEINGGVAKLNAQQLDNLAAAVLDAYCHVKEAQDELDRRHVQDVINKAFENVRRFV